MTIKRAYEIDKAVAVWHFENFIRAMGYDMDNTPAMSAEASGKNTAERAVGAFVEFLTKEQEHFNFTMFPWSGPQEMIAVTHMEFSSLCVHHFLPYVGVAHVGYIPAKKVCGLSKIVRVVDHYAHRPSVQEELTAKVGTFLMEQLVPVGCGVVIEASHSCMSMRGVCRPGHITVTSDMRGCFETVEVRSEFLALIEGARFRNK